MNRKIHPLAAPLFAALIVAGCGGGGDGGRGFPFAFVPPPTTTTPPPAMGNPYDDFIAFVKGLIETALDTAEPADVAAFDPPPTSDTQDPIAVQ